MLELAILGLLKERPMHGYDLRKRLRSGFGLLATLSFGSLYPALARLEKAGAVRELGEEPIGQVLPLTGSLAGERASFRLRSRRAARGEDRAERPEGARTRERKVYELTEEGEKMFVSLLGDESDRQIDDKSFAIRWAFARHLSCDGRLRLLERQRRRLSDRLADSERALGGPLLDHYERQLAEHAVESLRKDLAWIESLIATEGSEPVITSAERAVALTAGAETEAS